MLELPSSKLLPLYELLESTSPDIVILFLKDTAASLNQLTFVGYNSITTLGKTQKQGFLDSFESQRKNDDTDTTIYVIMKQQYEVEVIDIYRDYHLTITVKQKNSYFYLIACNIVNKESRKSIQKLVKNLNMNYLNTQLIIGGKGLQKGELIYAINNQKHYKQFQKNDFELLTSGEIMTLKSAETVMTKEPVLEIVYRQNISNVEMKPVKFQGEKPRKEIINLLRNASNEFSLITPMLDLINREVHDRVRKHSIGRPSDEFIYPYKKGFHDQKFIEKFWSQKLMKINKAFQHQNLMKIYNDIIKALYQGYFKDNAIETENGTAFEEYKNYYGELYKDESLKLELFESSVLPNFILVTALFKGIEKLKIGQPLSYDLIPDDCFEKIHLYQFALRDIQQIFHGYNEMAYKTKALLLSKTGSTISNPSETKIQIFQPLVMRVYDAAIYNLIKTQLWAPIGTYQFQFRSNISKLEPLQRILEVIKQGDKHICFLTLNNPYETINRSELIQILQSRLISPSILNHIIKLLIPQQCYLPQGSYFFQQKGLPQNLACSTILYVTYIDEMLKKYQLDQHQIYAYGHKMAFIADTLEEMATIQEKIRILSEHVTIKQEKTGVLNNNNTTTTNNILCNDIDEAADDNEKKVQENFERFKFLGAIWISFNKEKMIEANIEELDAYCQKMIKNIKQLDSSMKLEVFLTFVRVKTIQLFLPLHLQSYVTEEQLYMIFTNAIEKNVSLKLKQLTEFQSQLDYHAQQLQGYLLSLPNNQMRRQMNTITNKLSVSHLQLVHLLTSKWVILNKIMICKKHKTMMGIDHICDEELLEKIEIPRTIKEVIQLDEIQAAILIEKFQQRIKEICIFKRATDSQRLLQRKEIEQLSKQLKNYGFTMGSSGGKSEAQTKVNSSSDDGKGSEKSNSSQNK